MPRDVVPKRTLGQQVLEERLYCRRVVAPGLQGHGRDGHGIGAVEPGREYSNAMGDESWSRPTSSSPKKTSRRSGRCIKAPVRLGPHDELESKQVHHVQNLLKLHGRLSVLEFHDEAVAGVAEAGDVELLEGGNF